MSLNRFAAIESRLNGAVERHLSNVEVVYMGGEAFGAGISREPSADPFGGSAIDTADFMLSFDGAHAPGIAEGHEITIGGVVYVVSSGVQPSASGWLNLSVYPKKV